MEHAPTQRIEQLDGVRALAIGMVFLNHAFRIKMMWAGVDLFFMLSGFLITGILIGGKKRSFGGFLGHFYQRRARRILPPYLLLLVITTIFFGVIWLRYIYMYLFLMNFVTAFFPHLASLDVLWSLAVEEQFYLVWPLMVFFLSEMSLTWAAAGLVVAAPLLRYFCTPLFPSYAAVYMLTPFRMDLLATGALLAIAWRKRQHWIGRFGQYGLLLSFAAMAALFLLARRRPGFTITAKTPFGNLWIYELTLLASLGVLLWALSGRHVGLLKIGWVRYVGRISYSFYLIHTTVMLLLEPHVRQRWLVAGLGLGIALGYSALSWEYFEKPILYARSGSAVRKEALADERAITRHET